MRQNPAAFCHPAKASLRSFPFHIQGEFIKPTVQQGYLRSRLYNSFSLLVQAVTSIRGLNEKVVKCSSLLKFWHCSIWAIFIRTVLCNPSSMPAMDGVRRYLLAIKDQGIDGLAS